MNQHFPSKKYLFLSFILILLFSCNKGSRTFRIAVTNEAEIPRTAEAVQVRLTELRGISSKDYQNICIRDENGKQLLSQLNDMDSDSVPEYIIFQADSAVNASNLKN